MPAQNYDFRQFQAELAALDSAPAAKPGLKSADRKTAAAARQVTAREEFLALRERHGLSVADVIAFFPEEEGIAYLQQLLAIAEQKPRRTRKKPADG
ncbi:MAG: 2-hydroxyacyl-CoA dehydratase [Rhodanobacter sp.]|nr:MAG: 2-hydroxyacyl-CoA dehydratase [Rhodanobacter sp.]